jgi:hypothetical protein
MRTELEVIKLEGPEAFLHSLIWGIWGTWKTPAPCSLSDGLAVSLTVYLAWLLRGRDYFERYTTPSGLEIRFARHPKRWGSRDDG